MTIVDFAARKKQQEEAKAKPVAAPRAAASTPIRPGPVWMSSAWAKEVAGVSLPDVMMVIRLPGNLHGQM